MLLFPPLHLGHFTAAGEGGRRELRVVALLPEKFLAPRGKPLGFLGRGELVSLAPGLAFARVSEDVAVVCLRGGRLARVLARLARGIRPGERTMPTTCRQSVACNATRHEKYVTARERDTA